MDDHVRQRRAGASWTSAGGPDSARAPVGGAAGGTIDVADEFPLLKPGTRYVLFLTPSPLAGEWYPVGAFQGVFTVSPEGHVNSLGGGAAGGMAVKDMPLDAAIQAVQAEPALNVSP